MMKTRVQKWLPVITGLMFSMHALAYDFESGGIYYNYKEFSDSEVYVTHNGTPYSGNSYSGHVKIPKTVTYNSKMYRVTEIGQQAFKSCKKLISVEIPESVTKIGNGAFDYSGLSSVNIPNSVTIIENNAFSSTQLTSIRIPGNATQWERAFAGCSKLTTVIIESGIKKIEKGAFANCTGLTSVSIPNSVTVISESAFSSCTALTSIDIPNSVTEISSTAFSGCKSLIHISIPEKITGIGTSAFSDCTALSSITFPSTLTGIGDNCLEGCTGLTTVDIPATVSYIGHTSFKDCTKLTSVSIPDGVTGIIGREAFSGCVKLSSITIPQNLEGVRANAFSGCLNLKSVTWNARDCSFSRDNVFPTSVITSFTFGDNVEKIPEGICEDMEKLTSVTIPESVTSIGKEAFKNCTELTSVVWKARKCANFSNSAYSPQFNTCPNITSFTFGENVEKIPAYLCSGITQISEISIPESVTYMGRAAFKECPGITSVRWNARTCTDFTSAENSAGFNTCPNITAFAFGENVEKIPAYLCFGMERLTEIILPQKTTTLGNGVFKNCIGLQSISIPLSTTTIGADAFNDCMALTSVIWNARWCSDFTSSPFNASPNIASFTFGEGVERIPAFLCRGLEAIDEITLPEGATYIGAEAFSGCSGVTVVNLGNSLTNIGSKAFYGCGLSTVSIPMSLTSIGAEAFGDCVRLKSVIWDARNCSDFATSFPETVTAFTFGKNVRLIPSGICQDMALIDSISIPSTVTHIGDFAFYGCDGLERIISSASIPPTISETTFEDYTTKLYVPIGSKTRYHEADYWSNFTDLRNDGASYTIVLSTDIEKGSVSGGGLYEDGEIVRISATPKVGYLFARWSDGNTENPRKITVESELSLTAEFTAVCRLSVLSNDATMGTVKGSGEYAESTIVILSALPNEGFQFARWNDGSTENPRPMTVMDDTELTAEFLPLHSLSVAADNTTTGIVEGSGEYAEGTVVILSALPNEGFQFARWNDGNTENPRPVTVMEDTELTAEFETGSHRLSVRSGNEDMGNVTALLTATPNTGYQFIHWNDGDISNPRTIAISENIDLIAKFEAKATNTDAISNDNERISVIGRTLYVENGGKTYRIYNTIGQLVYTGNDSEVSLSNPGIYTVCTGNRTQKIMIR
ncbi:leucine-rich repeat protein [Barnesiella intestinihominis]|uniref:leucine-rich repeat protein n=1 Tax=Barnesiella intestinihominis TaxID=487174 RepID=UPI003AAD083B